MTFHWPDLLWLLLLPAGRLTWELARKRRAITEAEHPKILRAEIGPHRLSLARRNHASDKARSRPWLAVGLAFAIVALARPQWGRIEEPVFDQSREILLALDLSRSMLSTDVKPSRLDRAKLLIQALLEKLKGERVGLVVFSGTSFLQSPLSSDYEILREFLPSLTPDYMPEGGTNYGALLDTSLEAFGNSSAADRFLIVLSDGEATDEDWRSRIDELKKRGIRVIGLGVGTAGGSMIPDGSGGFVKDERGAVVLSKLESDTLRQLSAATNGVYRDASTWVDLAGLIEQTVDAGRKGSFVNTRTIRLVERYQWPLALALWCLLVSFYYEFPIRPRARDVRLQEAARPSSASPAPARSAPAVMPPPTSAALLALGLGLGLIAGALWPPDVHAAVKIAPPPPGPAGAPVGPPASIPGTTGSSASEAPPLLGRIVARLSQEDRLSSPDLSEFAHETLSWGQHLKRSGQPVPEGPVHDALQAVDELAARGNNLADWSQLRRQLQELLQKPPQPPKPPPSSNQNNKPQQNHSPQDKSSPQQNQSGSQQQQERRNQSQSASDSQHSQGQKSDAGRSSPKSSDQSAFGRMNQPPKAPPPPSSEMQKVGGAKDNPANQPENPALALPMEKLDQLKNQDSPAQLFELMQGDRSEASRKKPEKNW